MRIIIYGFKFLSDTCCLDQPSLVLFACDLNWTFFFLNDVFPVTGNEQSTRQSIRIHTTHTFQRLDLNSWHRFSPVGEHTNFIPMNIFFFLSVFFCCCCCWFHWIFQFNNLSTFNVISTERAFHVVEKWKQFSMMLQIITLICRCLWNSFYDEQVDAYMVYWPLKTFHKQQIFNKFQVDS